MFFNDGNTGDASLDNIRLEPGRVRGDAVVGVVTVEGKGGAVGRRGEVEEWKPKVWSSLLGVGVKSAEVEAY